MRFFHLTLAISIFLANMLTGQNNPLDVFNTTPFMDENGVLLNDGDVLMVIYAGADKTIDPPVMNVGGNNNGQATGDDSILVTSYIGANVPPNIGTFYVTLTAYPDHSQGYPAIGDSIYVRVFNDNSLPNATYYGDGQLHYVSNQLGDTYDVQLPDDKTGSPLFTTGVKVNQSLLPERHRLYQNYPNPFNPVTTIRVEIPASAERTALKVYDIMGREVSVLADNYLAPGTHFFRWNGDNKNGEPAASGIYLLEMKNRAYFDMKKMFLLR